MTQNSETIKKKINLYYYVTIWNFARLTKTANNIKEQMVDQGITSAISIYLSPYVIKYVCICSIISMIYKEFLQINEDNNQ